MSGEIPQGITLGKGSLIRWNNIETNIVCSVKYVVSSLLYAV